MRGNILHTVRVMGGGPQVGVHEKFNIFHTVRVKNGLGYRLVSGVGSGIGSGAGSGVGLESDIRYLQG